MLHSSVTFVQEGHLLMLSSLPVTIQLGMLYALMSLGVYITFRILNFPDLTVDGSFTTGGAVAAIMIMQGYHPWLALAGAFVGGLLAGVCTGLLHTKGKINGLLSGILMMIALHSINYRIMGMPNVSLFKIDTIFPNASAISEAPYLRTVVFFSVILGVLIIKLLLDWFLHTDLGLALRATGDNDRMIRSFGANTDMTKIVGISLSNGLVALSGGLIAQSSAYADVYMGVGMIVIGLASVIIGEAIFGTRNVFFATLAAMLGSVIYRIIVDLALRVEWLEASDMKLITALIVIIALVVPAAQKQWRNRSVARKRALTLHTTDLPGGESDA